MGTVQGVRMRVVGTAWLWVLALLVACGGGDGPEGDGSGGAQRGGTVVVGMRSDFGPLNPILSTDQYTEEINKYALYTPLVTYDKDLNVQPHLAESWELQGDTAVLFRLRRDVKWHDGQPVTAEDVKFTFDMAKDPAAASLIGSAYIAEVRAAEVVDPYTIRFIFARPHAQALEDFWWAPAPKHLLQNVGAAEMRNSEFNRQPVGSGPFKFGEWRAGERLVLVRNDQFPASLGGPPNVDRVVFRVIPEPPTMMTELLTGGVDVDVPVVPDQVAELRKNNDVKLFAFPGRTVYYIGWNTQRAPFTDAAVRRAMTLAINRQQIIDAILQGQATPATSPIPPWSPLHPGSVQPLPYDAGQAQQLLEQAGWRDANGDGTREKGGTPLRFTLITSDNPVNRAVAEVVQADLKRVGVDAQVRILEFQTLLAQHKGRDFDAVFTSWVMDNFQVAAAPTALLHSKFATVPQSTNRSGYRNPRADAIMDRAYTATDPAAAKAAWGEFTELMKEEQPFTFMFWLNELAAAGPRVQNVEMDVRSEIGNIREWWVQGR